MRTLSNMFEGLLDADFDIGEQDIMLEAIKDWISFALKNKWDKAKLALMKIISDHGCTAISSMKRSQLAKTNMLISIVDEGDGLPEAKFISFLPGARGASQVHISWLGKENRGHLASVDWNNIISVSNKRNKGQRQDFTAPQYMMQPIVEFGKVFRSKGY